MFEITSLSLGVDFLAAAQGTALPRRIKKSNKNSTFKFENLRTPISQSYHLGKKTENMRKGCENVMLLGGSKINGRVRQQ